MSQPLPSLDRMIPQDLQNQQLQQGSFGIQDQPQGRFGPQGGFGPQEPPTKGNWGPQGTGNFGPLQGLGPQQVGLGLNSFPQPQVKPTEESSKPNLSSASFILKEVRCPESKIRETVGPNGGYQTQKGANPPQEGYPPQEGAQQRYYPPQKNADRSQQKTSPPQQGDYPLYEGYPPQQTIYSIQQCYYLSQQELPTYLQKQVIQLPKKIMDISKKKTEPEKEISTQQQRDNKKQIDKKKKVNNNKIELQIIPAKNKHGNFINFSEFNRNNSATWMGISILDIVQMFGRVGRPQFDKKGVGMIFCQMTKLSHFVQKLKNQINIESALEK